MEEGRSRFQYAWDWDPSAPVEHGATFRESSSLKPLADIGDIIGHGWINCWIKLQLESKKDLRPYRGDIQYELVFAEGTQKMIGVSPNRSGEAFFTQLEIGVTYKVCGKILVRPRNFNYVSKSTSNFDLFLFGIYDFTSIALRNTTSLRLSPPLSGIPKVLQALSLGYQENGLLEDLERVTIIGGEVQRYVGCNICTKRIRTEGTPAFRCTDMRCNNRSKRPEVSMYITGLTLGDCNGNVLTDFLAFNEASEAILGKAANEFLHDGEANDLLQRLFKSVLINVRVIVEQPVDENPNPRRIAKFVEIISRLQGSDSVANGNGDLPGNNNRVVDLNDTIMMDGSSGSRYAENITVQVNIDRIIDGIDLLSVENADQDDIFRNIPATPRLYPLNGNPSGYSLIICNVDFPRRNPPSSRTGSMLDVEKLTEVLRKLSMPVFQTHINVTSRALKKILEDFRKHLIETGASACCVAFMSHGGFNTAEMVDGVEIFMNTQFYHYFSNQQFPEFLGKPKIFINEACQSYSPLSDVLRTGCPAYSDMLICNPSSPGYYAFRDTRKGSAYIQAICKVFAKFAAKEDIQQMLWKVQAVVSNETFKCPRDPTDPNSTLVTHKQIPVHYGMAFGHFKFNFRNVFL